MAGCSELCHFNGNGLLHEACILCNATTLVPMALPETPSYMKTPKDEGISARQA